MNWLYDESTEVSRVMVGYDGTGVTVRIWEETYQDNGEDDPFRVTGYWISWYHWNQLAPNALHWNFLSINDWEIDHVTFTEAALKIIRTEDFEQSDDSGYVQDLRTYYNGCYQMKY